MSTSKAQVIALSLGVIIYLFSSCNNYSNSKKIDVKDSVFIHNYFSKDSIEIINIKREEYLIKIDSIQVLRANEEIKRGNFVLKTNIRPVNERLKEVLFNDYGISVEETNEIGIDVFNNAILSSFFLENKKDDFIIKSLIKAKNHNKYLPVFKNIDSTYNYLVSTQNGFDSETYTNCKYSLKKNVHNLIKNVDICNLHYTKKEIVIQFKIDTNGVIKNPQIIYKICPIIDQKILSLIDTNISQYSPAYLENKKIVLKKIWIFSWDGFEIWENCE